MLAISPYRAGYPQGLSAEHVDKDCLLFRPEKRAKAVSAGQAAVMSQGESLARRFIQGDPEVVARTRKVVSKVVRVRGYFIPRDERPDVMQEALLDVTRAVMRSEIRDEDDFYGFVRTVTYRRCIDRLRRRRRKAQVDASVVRLIRPDDRLLARERDNIASETFSRLRKSCQDLFGLRIGLGMTYAQMAPFLGRSEGALRTQSYYCLQQARVLVDRMQRKQKLMRPAARRRR